jgi:hypothetical protein
MISLHQQRVLTGAPPTHVARQSANAVIRSSDLMITVNPHKMNIAANPAINAELIQTKTNVLPICARVNVVSSMMILSFDKTLVPIFKNEHVYF